jgi:5-methylcytosine-specific restriction endonuclease McrA
VPGDAPGVRLSVDHIMPLSQGGPLLPGRESLRVLCLKCHGKATKHTARFNGGR